MKKVLSLTVLFLFLALPIAVFAETTPVEMSGTAFIYYEDDQMSGSTVPAKFDIGRVYLDFKKALDRSSSVRVTTDIERIYPVTMVSPEVTDGRFDLFLKYAYFELGNPGVPFIGLNSVLVGQSSTHWTGMVENFWKYRYIQKTMTDYFGIFTTADLGLAAKGQFNALIPISYHATLMNGSGFKNAETNPEKNIAVTFSGDPFVLDKTNKVTTALGVYVKDVPLDGKSVDHGETADLYNSINGLVGWQFSNIGNGILFAEYFVANNAGGLSNGLSLGGQYEIYPDVNILARVDDYDPDMLLGSDQKILDIIGLEYKWGANIRMALDWQAGTTGDEVATKKMSVHSEVKW